MQSCGELEPWHQSPEFECLRYRFRFRFRFGSSYRFPWTAASSWAPLIPSTCSHFTINKQLRFFPPGFCVLYFAYGTSVCCFFFMRTHLNRSNPQSMRQQHIYVGRFAVMRGLIGGKGRWWAGFCKGLTCVAKGKPPIPIRKRGLALLKLDSPGPRLIPSFLGIKWPKFKSIFCLLIILWRIGAFFLFFRRIAKYVHMYEIAFVLADVEFPPLSSFSCAFSRDRYRNRPEIPVAYSEAETESEALKECQLYHKAVSLQKGFANNFITHLATWT